MNLSSLKLQWLMYMRRKKRNEEPYSFETPEQEEKISLTEKIKIMLSKMFEVEDQPIK